MTVHGTTCGRHLWCGRVVIDGTRTSFFSRKPKEVTCKSCLRLQAIDRRCMACAPIGKRRLVKEPEQKCRVCGCMWDSPCEPDGCSWVESDLCSACAEEMPF